MFINFLNIIILYKIHYLKTYWTLEPVRISTVILRRTATNTIREICLAEALRPTIWTERDTPSSDGRERLALP